MLITSLMTQESDCLSGIAYHYISHSSQANESPDFTQKASQTRVSHVERVVLCQSITPCKGHLMSASFQLPASSSHSQIPPETPEPSLQVAMPSCPPSSLMYAANVIEQCIPIGQTRAVEKCHKTNEAAQSIFADARLLILGLERLLVSLMSGRLYFVCFLRRLRATITGTEDFVTIKWEKEPRTLLYGCQHLFNSLA
jgi:hypothetical protein